MCMEDQISEESLEFRYGIKRSLAGLWLTKRWIQASSAGKFFAGSAARSHCSLRVEVG